MGESIIHRGVSVKNLLQMATGVKYREHKGDPDSNSWP